jgi:hypothetical protein
MKQITIPSDIGSKPYLDAVSLYHDEFDWVIHPLKTAACGGKQPIDDMALGTAGVDRQANQYQWASVFHHPPGKGF